MDLKKIAQFERGRFLNTLRKQVPVLQQLFWECTLDCNLNCKHCGSDCKTIHSKPNMPLNDFIPVLEDIRNAMDPRQIMIITTGGEPLLRKDILSCGKSITNRGFFWGMVTNGMLLDKYMLLNLIDTGISAISISLDGFEDDHNWLRGNSNSFNNAVSAIKLLSDYSMYISWDVITCVNKRNLTKLSSFRDFLGEIGVKNWRLFTIFPTGRAASEEDLQLNRQELFQLMHFISETRNLHTIHTSFGCEGFLGPFEYEVRDNQYFCHAGINTASILLDGSISGCLSIRSTFYQGNIYKDSFVKIWKNKFEKYRNRLWMKTDLCETCEVWRWCEGNGMHLRDNDGKLLLCNYKKMYSLN